MPRKININEVFENIDKKLIEQKVPITHRFLEATVEVSKFFGDIAIPLSPQALLLNNDLGNNLCVWLDKWYTSKYGEGRKLNMDLGSVYILTQGDLWKYRVPNFYGSCNFFIDRNLLNEGESNETNIMRMCEKMTLAYVKALNDIELEKLFIKYRQALEVFQIFSAWNFEKLAMIEAFRADLANVASQLDGNFPHYGEALWSYMQCSEKILKSWLLKTSLTTEELKNKYGHKIEKLAQAFNKYYKPQISLTSITLLNCSTDARYDGHEYTQEDILRAQDSFFQLILDIGYSPEPQNK